ncbi:MAG: hypothetical protein J6J31_04960, partial [Thermoguttaceae bacterium]|nr:hypothetical protein [Thermoguttaceae bacterium]
VEKAAEVLKDYGEELLGKMTVKQIQNEVVRAFTPDNRRRYDCLSEIRLAMVPVAVRDYLDLW